MYSAYFKETKISDFSASKWVTTNLLETKVFRSYKLLFESFERKCLLNFNWYTVKFHDFHYANLHTAPNIGGSILVQEPLSFVKKVCRYIKAEFSSKVTERLEMYALYGMGLRRVKISHYCSKLYKILISFQVHE